MVPSEPLRRQAGFGMIEAMFGLLVLAIALLTHMSGVMGEHRLVREERARTGVLGAMAELHDRLHADEDKPGLYARLQTRALHARQAGTLADDEVRLANGRRAYLPTVYFPDFVGSPLGTTHVLLDVPISTPVDPDDPRLHVLREDLADTTFGLPADLDGDGVIDAAPRDDDHGALPVRLHLHWIPHGESAREMAITTWVRVER